ncbi:MAG: OstA-like protein [Roseivirga sp.]
MAQKYDKSLILRILKMKRHFLILLIFTLSWSALQAQTRITVKYTDLLKPGVVNNQPVRKLLGNVHLIQGTTNIYCDSAYFYQNNNSAQAFGNVHILDEVDTLDLRGEYMEYEGNNRLVKVRRNVIFKDDSTNLYTEFLDYNRDTDTGYYFNGGKLVDSTNVLTSTRGYYNSRTKKAQFIDSVVLVSPDFYMETDTLDYFTVEKEALSSGRTYALTAEKDTLRSTRGMLYKQLEQYSEVYKGTIITAEYEIKGDTLIANDSLKYYQGMQNVTLESFEDSLKIYGNQVRYDKLTSTAKVYDQAYLRKMMLGDSLFIKGDTLLSIQNEEKSEKLLSAYFGAQMYKSDMQARADSLTYNISDSTIYMFRDPVIWNIDSQITADSIRITTANNRIHRMYLTQNSFVISQDSSQNFNQVKGRDMVIYFEDGYIERSDVFGNGESIYFTGDTGGGSSSMNSLKCSNMRIFFSNNFVTELRNYREVDGSLIPPFEINDPERKLRGFVWRIREKPTLQSIVKRLRYDR